jgi:hypothetical protein
MGKRIAAFDAYINKSKPFARPILEYLRDLVHEACPDVEEAMKWSFPCFDYKGPFCSMAAFNAHATFGFWKHGLLIDRNTPLGKSNEKAMGSFGRLTAIEDLPSRRTLVALVKKAKKLNDDGVKNPARVRKQPAAVRPPAYFLTALRGNRRALATYEGFSPSNRREYVDWVTEAKTEETRTRRLATAIEWMAAGKARNWKYERR